MKQLTESIMNNKNIKKDIEESTRKIKTSEEAQDVVKEMEKILKSKDCDILWLAYQQGKIFKNLKPITNS